MEKEKDERRPMQTVPSAPELVSCFRSHIKCAVPDCFMQSADLQKERENHSLEDSLKTMLLLGSGGNSATAEKETYHLAVQVRRPPTRHLAFGGVVALLPNPCASPLRPLGVTVAARLITLGCDTTDMITGLNFLHLGSRALDDCTL